jgi:pimeloyl-ACP methyl ester carboxylesterase
MPKVMSGGVPIHYRVEGRGFPLAMLHGSTLCSEVWGDYGYIDALRERRRLVLIDSRGHGQSGKPISSATRWAVGSASAPPASRPAGSVR